MKLLTIKDLSIRWQVTEQTINKYIKDGVIEKVPSLPCIRFRADYIETIENNQDHCKTYNEILLEKKLEIASKENKELKKRIGNLIGELSGILYEENY